MGLARKELQGRVSGPNSRTKAIPLDKTVMGPAILGYNRKSHFLHRLGFSTCLWFPSSLSTSLSCAGQRDFQDPSPHERLEQDAQGSSEPGRG